MVITFRGRQNSPSLIIKTTPSNSTSVAFLWLLIWPQKLAFLCIINTWKLNPPFWNLLHVSIRKPCDESQDKANAQIGCSVVGVIKTLELTEKSIYDKWSWHCDHLHDTLLDQSYLITVRPMLYLLIFDICRWRTLIPSGWVFLITECNDRPLEQITHRPYTARRIPRLQNDNQITKRVITWDFP